MIRRHARQLVVTHPAIQHSDTFAQIDMVETEWKRSKFERRPPSLPDGCKCIGEVLSQVSMNHRDRTIVEVPHHHHGMAQLLAEQDGVADHVFALEGPFPRGQSQMAIKDVKDGTPLDFEINAQTVSRL